MDENKELLTEEQTAPEQPQKKKMGKAELVCTIIFLVIAGAAVGFFGYTYFSAYISALAGNQDAGWGVAFSFIYNLYFNSAVVVGLIIFIIVMRIIFKRVKIPFIALMVEIGVYMLINLTFIIMGAVN